MPKKPLMLAHRGYWEIAAENTEHAFDAAKLFGFDGVEMDVHQTKDNQLVVIHDEKIDRTANGTGFVKDMTLEELRKFDYTSKFDTSHPYQTIMTFEEFLTKFSPLFKTINVEVKTDITHYKGIEQQILDVHHKVNPKCQIIYSSFNFESMKIMRELDKDVEIGFLFVDAPEITPILDEVKRVCQYLHPWFKTMVKPESYKVYKETGLPMNIWTFDRREIGDEWSDGSNALFEEIKNLDNVNALIGNSKFKI